MKYWLHRISYFANVSYPLLDKGYLSIGFSDFTDETFIKEVSESNWDYFEKAFKETWGNCPATRYNLWRFIAEMCKNDIVLIPNPWKTFSIYEIEEQKVILPSSLPIDNSWFDWNKIKITRDKDGHLILDGEKDGFIDLGFFRKVKLIEREIPRYEYADEALYASMKNRKTNVNITKLKESIEDAIKSFQKKEPINLKNCLFESSIEKWLEIIHSKLNPTKFEKLVKLFFERVGATSIEMNPDKNNPDKAGDVDVIADFEPIKTIINVQVKFHKNETNEIPVQQIRDFANSQENLNDGYSRQYWIISSCDSFSDECNRLAFENSIILINGNQFIRMIMEAGLQNIIEI